MLIVISLDALLKKYTEKLTSETERRFSREIRGAEIRVEPLQNWNRNGQWRAERVRWRGKKKKENERLFVCRLNRLEVRIQLSCLNTLGTF